MKDNWLKNSGNPSLQKSSLPSDLLDNSSALDYYKELILRDKIEVVFKLTADYSFIEDDLAFIAKVNKLFDTSHEN